MCIINTTYRNDTAMNYITDTNQVNIKKLNALMNASLQAYNAFDDNKPTVCEQSKIVCPDGFEFVTCWSGIDSVFHKDPTEETYGVVFCSSEPPYTYIFAFRGTASLLDAIDDLGFEHAQFRPFNGSSVSNAVQVEAGFNDIYTESTHQVKSMQNQVFNLLDSYLSSNKPLSELWITGHSLGSSLSTLFSLDVGLCRPAVRATNMNFACPRTGNQAFVDLFEKTLAPHNTLRVQNTYDKVPCAPFEDMGYAHTPWALLLAFYEKGFAEINWVARHSALNYQAVIQCAEKMANGVCLSDLKVKHPDGKSTTTQDIKSIMPNTSTVCDIL